MRERTIVASVHRCARPRSRMHHASLFAVSIALLAGAFSEAWPDRNAKPIALHQLAVGSHNATATALIIRRADAQSMDTVAEQATSRATMNLATHVAAGLLLALMFCASLATRLNAKCPLSG